MSQEYTEDKEVSLKPLSSGRRLLEALLILVSLFAVYLMVSLVSFNPSDPSWSQTAWHEPIHNLGGGVGAWLADTLDKLHLPEEAAAMRRDGLLLTLQNNPPQQ